MKAHFNPEPEQSDDESLSYDVIIGRHVTVQDQGHTFIDNGRAESEAAELNEEDKEADDEADDEDSEEDGSGVEDDDDDEEDDEEEGDVGSS